MSYANDDFWFLDCFWLISWIVLYYAIIIGMIFLPVLLIILYIQN